MDATLGIDDAAATEPDWSLRQLLAPLDVHEFLDQYWGKQSLHIRGTAAKFAQLFDRERFNNAVEAAAMKSHVTTFRLSAVVRDYDGSWSRREPIEPEQIDETLASGTSVCVNDISLGDERLSAICDAVRRRLQFVGTVRFNAYLSPDESGADMHFDSSVSTTLQIEGRKRWRFMMQPTVPWPPCNAQLRTDGSREWSLPWIGGRAWQELREVDERDLAEVVLEPGDVLCLPAGTWHSAKAVGHSLALNMALKPLNAFAVMTRLLEELFENRETWRGGPPPTRLPPSTAVPEDVRQYLNERIREVCSHLRTFDVGDELAQDVWRSLVGT